MKLHQFLKENSSHLLDDVLDTLRTNCSHFLDESRGNLYRGIGFNGEIKNAKSVDEVLERHFIRKDRRARDNKQEFNDFIDSVTKDAVGFKMRSESLFTTTDLDTAEHYGDVALIFPIGEFQFAWSPLIKDLYFTFFDAGTEDWNDELAAVMRPFITDVDDSTELLDDNELGNRFSKFKPNVQREIVAAAIERHPDVFFKTEHLGRAQLFGDGNEIMITNDSGYYQIAASTIRNLFELTPEEFYEML